MKKQPATANDWRTMPMPEAHDEFSFRRSFTPEQMELLCMGNVPEVMEDKWFWYYADNKLHIHRSWTGYCIFIVAFDPCSDVLHVTVNRDPAQYRSTDVHEDEYELRQLLNWWTQPEYDPYDQFVSDTYRALLPLMQKDHAPTVQEKIQGCLYGGAAGDALGYPVEFMSLDEIRAKYGPEGIRYYDLKNGRAPFSDDTQMLLFTLEGIYMWQAKLLKHHDGAMLKNTLYEAYRDWYFTQENDTPRKAKHKPRTRLYLLESMHRRRGPGFTCIRALRTKKPGSIGNLCNDSKGNGGVMRVAPIGFMFSREHSSPEEIMKKVVRLGAESAALTHGHPLGFISAGMMAGLINECVYGQTDDLREMIIHALHSTHAMFGNIPAMSELTCLIGKAMDLAEEDGDAVEHIAHLGHSACAESTMAIAVYCALRHQDNFDQAIRTAVNFDGDSDTVAAVTGNILGAWKGINCIDRKWIAPLHLDEYLKALNDYD